MDKITILQKVKSRKNWNNFVLSQFENIKLYAKKRNNFTPEIESLIEETAIKVADHFWNLAEGDINRWSVSMTIVYSYNHDNINNPSPARMINSDMRSMLETIEDDPTFSEEMLLTSARGNADFDINIRQI